jgi:tripeptide aminopeptidase
VVCQELKDLGLAWREDGAAAEINGECGNLIVEVPGSLSGPRIFFSAHLDTVEPTAGLRIQEADGALRSDGTTILGADDKGGLAPILEAIRSLKEDGEAHVPITLLFSVAEEIGLLGAAAMKIEELNLDFGFVFDTGPSVGSFVVRTAYHDALNARIVGRPAHAGKSPEEGINALEVAALAISRMKLGRIGPETTASFNRVHGGTAVNVVCPFVELEGEVRSTCLIELQNQADHMIQELVRAADQFGAEVHVDHHRHYSGYLVSEDHPCVRIALAAARSRGHEHPLRTTLGGSDANIFNARGLVCIVAGTGMEKIHTHEEFIRLDDLVESAEMVRALIREAGRLEKEA